MEAVSEFLISTGFWSVVNDHDWVWPVCEMFHFFGMAILIGTVGILDLRILGVGKGLPIAKLEALVPLGIAGFVVNALTGAVFIAGNPSGGPIAYLGNLAFQLKMLLVLLAGINLVAFYFTGISREAEALGPMDDAAVNAKIVAAASILLWIGVIIFGRLIMYNDTLLLFLGM